MKEAYQRTLGVLVLALGIIGVANAGTNSLPPNVYKACAFVEGTKGMGSGFWITSNTFVTCLHVIAEAGSKLAIKTVDGTTYKLASVLNYSIDDDVAVLRLTPESPNWLDLAEDVQVGASIWSIGNSEGAQVLKVDTGEVTGLGNRILEVTAQIRPGCSGGPIVTADGKCVGMTAFLKFPMISITGREPGVRGYKYDLSLNNARKFAIRSAAISECARTNILGGISIQNLRDINRQKELAPMFLVIDKFIAQSVFDALSTKLNFKQVQVKSPDETRFDSYLGVTVTVRPGQIVQDRHELVSGDPTALVEAALRCRVVAEFLNDHRELQDCPQSLRNLLRNLEQVVIWIPKFSEEYMEMERIPSAQGSEQQAKVEKQRSSLISIQRAYSAQIAELRKNYERD